MAIEYTLEEVSCRIESEGLDYALRYYADWSTIKDEKFQQLYQNYVAAANEIEEYLEPYKVEGLI